MSLIRNGCVRCDGCGKLSNHKTGEYEKPDGSAGYINSKGYNWADDFCDECEGGQRFLDALVKYNQYRHSMGLEPRSPDSEETGE